MSIKNIKNGTKIRLWAPFDKKKQGEQKKGYKNTYEYIKNLETKQQG